MSEDFNNLQKQQLKITLNQLSGSIEQLQKNLENMEGSDNSQVVKLLKSNIVKQNKIFAALIEQQTPSLKPLYILSGLALISNIATISFLLWT